MRGRGAFRLAAGFALLIVFLGVTVGGIAICMFLPIFKLSELVGAKH